MSYLQDPDFWVTLVGLVAVTIAYVTLVVNR
eukprot:g12378.t1